MSVFVADMDNDGIWILYLRNNDDPLPGMRMMCCRSILDAADIATSADVRIVFVADMDMMGIGTFIGS
jgi:predicted RNA-binding protein with PUA domain